MKPIQGASLIGGLILAAVALAGCATGAPTTSVAATGQMPDPTRAATPAVTTAAATTAPSVAASPELLAIASSFELAETSPAGATTIVMALNPAPAFDPAEITVPAGTVVLFLSNPADAASPARHNLRIGPVLHKEQAHSPELNVGEAGILTLEAVPPGRYIYWCTVDSHYLGGMRGVLNVAP